MPDLEIEAEESVKVSDGGNLFKPFGPYSGSVLPPLSSAGFYNTPLTGDMPSILAPNYDLALSLATGGLNSRSRAPVSSGLDGLALVAAKLPEEDHFCSNCGLGRPKT